MNRLATVTVLLVLSCAAHAGGSAAIVGGRMLNNAEAGKPGNVYGAELIYHGSKYGARFNYIRVGPTLMAENMAYSTFSFTERHNRVTYAVGVVSQISLSTGGYWLGVHYPNDGQHFSNSCRWCGSVYAIDYAVTKHLSARVQYVEENRLNPTYNGTTVMVVVAL